MLEAISGLVERNVEVSVIAPHAGELITRLQQKGVPVKIVPHFWWVASGHWRGLRYRLERLRRNIYFGKELYRSMKEAKPDVVISNTLTIPSGAFAARWAGIPHIWYVHEFGQRDHGLHFDFGESLSLFLMDKLSARIIGNSKVVLENLKTRIPLDKLRLVYQEVRVPPQPARLENENRILKLIQVGTLTPGKRQEDAIRALAALVKKGLELHLTLLGAEDVNYGKDLRNLCRELGVVNDVDFIPFTNDPFSYIAAADLALVCSRSEAFGRVTIEAMKLGKPVVGANSAGTAELISDGATGLIFQMGDPQDLGRKIEIFYHDRQRLKEMGRGAQAWATQNFTREKSTLALLDVLREAVA